MALYCRPQAGASLLTFSATDSFNSQIKVNDVTRTAQPPGVKKPSLLPRRVLARAVEPIALLHRDAADRLPGSRPGTETQEGDRNPSVCGLRWARLTRQRFRRPATRFERSRCIRGSARHRGWTTIDKADQGSRKPSAGAVLRFDRKVAGL
jgi:hypothetical protein